MSNRLEEIKARHAEHHGEVGIIGSCDRCWLIGEVERLKGGMLDGDSAQAQAPDEVVCGICGRDRIAWFVREHYTQRIAELEAKVERHWAALARLDAEYLVYRDAEVFHSDRWNAWNEAARCICEEIAALGGEVDDERP
jgi:hypothetical protein